MSYEGMMTWGDLVKKYFPDADDEACDFILWEKTAFPMAPVETIEKQLQEYQVNCFAERRSNPMYRKKDSDEVLNETL